MIDIPKEYEISEITNEDMDNIKEKVLMEFISY